MNYLKTAIDGVYIIEPKRFGDLRGYFMETFKLDEFHANVDPNVNFVQSNESMSTPVCTSRKANFRRLNS